MSKQKGIMISHKDGRRVVEGTGYYKPDAVEDLKLMVRGSAEKFGDADAFKYKGADGSIVRKSYVQFSKDVDCLGTALVNLGLKGSRIAIIGENRYEWSVACFAIINGTGVSVPLDKYLPVNEAENLALRSKAEAIIYSPQYSGMIKDLADKNEGIRYYICMENTGQHEAGAETGQDSTGASNNADNAGVSRLIKSGRIFTDMPSLIEKGASLIAAGDRSFIDAVIDRDAMSLLLFTSGTTSTSKGVMLSHTNIASNVSSVTTVINAGPGDVHLSLLPLHHSFESTVGLMYMVHRGVCIAYCEGIKYIVQNMNEFDVTILVVVPAILEVMYKKLKEGIKKAGKERLIGILSGVSAVLRLLGVDIRKKLFARVLNQLGHSLRLAVSGAAALDPEIVEYFDKIGLRVIQGYGLTEASPIVAANNDFINKTGTIGHPIGSVEVTIDMPDENGMGEILTRGRNVMLGYFEDKAATDAVIDEKGWLRTGDLGTIDWKGFTRITGRAKSMIVFTNGKKAFPEEYESLLNAIPGVKESFVWGNAAPDGDVQICAEIVPDKEKYIAENIQMPTEVQIAEMYAASIKIINSNLPQYKIIRYFVISGDELIKTTTLKIKRNGEREKIMGRLSAAGLDMRRASGRYI